MITSIHLVNFQRHSDLTVNLCPTVNTLIGPTDSGKSAVIRALRWVGTNEPNGLGFLKDGTDKVIVSVSFGTGDVVQRIRSKSVNEYWLNEKVFHAFGRTVPEEIAKLFGTIDLNWQDQHDPPFLLSDSPGEVTRILNSVANLELIDNVVSTANAALKESRSTERRLTEQMEQIRGDLKRFENLPVIEGGLVSCRQLDQKRIESYNKIRQLQSIIESLHQVSLGLKCTEKAPAARSRLTKMKSRGWEPYQQKQFEINKLVSVCASLESVSSELAAIPQIPPGALTDSKTVMDKMVHVQKRLRELESMIANLKRIRMEVSSLDGRLKSLKVDLKKIQPKVCPTCGQIIPEK